MFDLEEILKNTLAEKRQQKGKDLQGSDLEIALAGKYLDAERSVFLTEYRYKLPCRHGNGFLEKITVPQVISVWAGIEGEVDHERLVFYDTETTGLSGGVGTWVFLTGVGRYEGNEFVLRQYFMPEPAEEDKYLEYLAGEFGEDTIPVSFNGRSYDANLLNTRFIVNGRRALFEQVQDIDLLYPARRFWKSQLSNCSLNNLEEQLLGLARDAEEDLPSEDIPEIYFDFLDTGRTEGLERVFNHNRTDILSMPVLLGLMKRVSECDCGVSFDPNGLGRLLIDQGEFEQAEQVFLGGLEGATSAACRKQLSFYYKKEGRYQEAIALWELAGEIYSWEEVAKYYEHKEKDYQRALTATEKAIEQLFAGDYLSGQKAAELQKRKSRLLRKIERADED